MAQYNQQSLDVINNWIKSERRILIQLAERWEDEKEYEQISDYQDVLDKKSHDKLIIRQMTPQPFGVIVEVEDDPYVHYWVTLTPEGDDWEIIVRQRKLLQ